MQQQRAWVRYLDRWSEICTKWIDNFNLIALTIEKYGSAGITPIRSLDLFLRFRSVSLKVTRARKTAGETRDNKNRRLSSADCCEIDEVAIALARQNNNETRRSWRTETAITYIVSVAVFNAIKTSFRSRSAISTYFSVG